MVLIFISLADFLTIVRNLLGTIHPRGHSNWAAEQTLQPLESDSFALEYLSTYDYNVEKALFSLYCEMGRGKGMLRVWILRMLPLSHIKSLCFGVQTRSSAVEQSPFPTAPLQT